MEEEKITFSVQMTAKEIFKFTVYHVYSGFAGIFGIVLSLAALVMLIVSFHSLSDQSKTVLTLVAAWYILIYPIMLYVRAGGQAKRNPSYQKPLFYQIDQSGITVSQEEVSQTVTWDHFVKLVETRTQYLIYTNRVHAFIFPKKEIGIGSDEFNQRVVQYIEGANIRLKGSIRNQKHKNG